MEIRFSQMLSSFMETIKNEHSGNSVKPEDRMLEMFMSKLMENPQKGIQSFDALLKLQEKIEKTQENNK